MESAGKQTGQAKGGEVNESWISRETALKRQLLELWNWVGERGSGKRQAARDSLTPDHRAYAEGSAVAYSNVRLRMRTLFAGLIDFGQRRDKDDG